VPERFELGDEALGHSFGVAAAVVVAAEVVGELLDLLVEEVDVVEDRADPDGGRVIKAALQRLLERGDLGAQPATAPGAPH
jgi:hypothetical protein